MPESQCVELCLLYRFAKKSSQVGTFWFHNWLLLKCLFLIMYCKFNHYPTSSLLLYCRAVEIGEHDHINSSSSVRSESNDVFTHGCEDCSTGIFGAVAIKVELFVYSIPILFQKSVFYLCPSKEPFHDYIHIFFQVWMKVSSIG